MSHNIMNPTNPNNTPNDEFPILCETCLGENPFVRMTKEPHGKACKICDRPFTVYRWRPGPRARFKKTELCHTCAKLKNVCQTCVLDLEYGLPVQVRDSALEDYEKLKMPTSDLNREYMIEAHERKQMTEQNASYGKMVTPPSALLASLARKSPYYRRNLPHVCSFFAAGTCNRGTLCPYRHEMPVTGEMANQNIKDRYFGQNDPVAKKMLRRSEERQALAVPSDTSITTLWVGGLSDMATESDLREHFQPFGEIASVRMVSSKNCAFVTYASRPSAERAAEKLYDKLFIGGSKGRIAWGRRQGTEQEGSEAKAPSASANANAPPGMAPPAWGGVPPPPPPGMGPAKPYYPSQDPSNMSAKLPI